MRFALFLVPAILAGLVLSGCELFEKKESQQSAQRAYPPAPVDTVTAVVADIPLSFSYKARLASPQSVIVLPKISATIIAQNFAPGALVKKDEVLFYLDDDLARASYEAAKASAQMAMNEFKRVSELFKKGVSSQKDYDTAKANKDSTAANLKIAELNLSYTKVKAPFTGIVGENLADVGSFANANSTQLVRLSRLDEIEARFYIADISQLNRKAGVVEGKLEQGYKAKLSLAGKEYDGVVKFIDSVIDNQSASVLAKASFKNSSTELMPGAVGEITMSGFVQNNAIKVPQIAILQDSSGPYVLIAKDSKVEKKPVKIASQTPSEAVVSSGLSDNDLIIINNFRKIRPGAAVSVTSIDGKPTSAK